MLAHGQIRATVGDAATTLPEIVEAITSAGGEVASAAEARPSYDEVFALLVERARGAQPKPKPETEPEQAA